MQFLTLLPLLATALAVLPDTPGLEIDYTLTHTCERKSQKGDTIYAHYLGTLQSTGAKFDSSYDRKTPFSFRLGQGQVIKGWDLGLLDMCPGDTRTLTIAPELGYGQRSMGPIPAGSTLVFKTELVSILGVPEEPKVVAPVESNADAVDPVPQATPEPDADEAAPVATESPEPLETPEPEAKQEL